MNSVIINNIEYTTPYWIYKNWNITADRLKKWREGRGIARKIKLNYIDLGNKNFIYNLEDFLIILKEHKKKVM